MNRLLGGSCDPVDFCVGALLHSIDRRKVSELSYTVRHAR
jgi:hypothetical protein